MIIAQVQTAPPEVVADAANKAAEEAPQGIFGSSFFLPAIIGMVVLMYMLTSANPKGQTAASKTELLANLKKNDRVVTAGGILGTVVNHRSDAEYVTLRVDDSSGSRMQVLASSIIRVVSDEDSDKKQD